MPYTMLKPSPVPCPIPLVVKNGSQAWRKVASSMPTPVSATSRQTKWPARASGWPRLEGGNLVQFQGKGANADLRRLRASRRAR